jgi:3-oxoadipate enol-lactonase
VERGFRCVELVYRGAGQTSVERGFSFDDMVGDILALMDAVGAEDACFAGISMGGFLCQGVALAAPEVVGRLALISTAASQEMIAGDERPWSTDVAQVHAKMAPYFTADFARRNEMLVKSMVKQIAKSVETGRFAENSELQRKALRGFDARARLGAIRCPTLVVHGTEDAIIPVAAARELAGLISGAKLAELPAAGHLLLAEKPKELYALVGDFFGG